MKNLRTIGLMSILFSLQQPVVAKEQKPTYTPLEVSDVVRTIAEYVFYRNIHIVQMGTLEGQTKFMRGKHLAAMKGFYIIDVTTNKKGEVDVFTPRFFPSYK